MSERVVDLLEAIEVEKESANGGCISLGALQHVLGAIEDERPVGKARESVVQRLIANLVDEKIVLHGNSGLAGQSGQALTEHGIVGQPLRLGVHGRHQKTSRSVIKDDGDRSNDLQTGREHDGPGMGRCGVQSMNRDPINVDDIDRYLDLEQCGSR